MPVIEVQRDSATRTPVQPRANETEIELVDRLVQAHGAGSVFIGGRRYSEAMKDLEQAAPDPLQPPDALGDAASAAPAATATKKTAGKKTQKGGAE
jgi:hypothetical protein